MGKQSLLDVVKGESRGSRLDWASSLTKAQKKELDEFVTSWNRGEIQNVSFRAVVRGIQKKFGIKAGRFAVQSYFDQQKEEKDE